MRVVYGNLAAFLANLVTCESICCDGFLSVSRDVCVIAVMIQKLRKRDAVKTTL